MLFKNFVFKLYSLTALGALLPLGGGGLPTYDYNWTLTGPSHPSGDIFGASQFAPKISSYECRIRILILIDDS